MKPGGGRSKGHQFERETAKELEMELGIKFSRILNQTREGGLADLEAVDFPDFPFVIECKRYAKGGVQPKWWDQVCVAADKAGNGKLPLLIWRGDRMPVRCRMPIQAIVGLSIHQPALDQNELYDWKYACELDWKTAMMVIREHLDDV